MSSSLIKSYNVNYGKTNSEGKKKTRVIDSNEAISDRIRLLSEALEEVASEEFADDFTEGLNAEMVDALLTDQQETEAGNEAYEKIIAQANEEAADILQKAQEKATGITEDANSAAEIIKSEARDAGHKEGYDAGYAEGVAAAEELKNQVLEEREAMKADFEARLDELEPQFVETLSDIYEYIFGVDLKDKKGLVLHLLNSAIRNIEGSRNFLVHVSKDDREEVEAGKDMLAEGLGASCSIEIIEDVTLSKGESFIETDGGIFDCGLGCELELLKKELRLLSYSKT